MSRGCCRLSHCWLQEEVAATQARLQSGTVDLGERIADVELRDKQLADREAWVCPHPLPSLGPINTSSRQSTYTMHAALLCWGACQYCALMLQAKMEHERLKSLECEVATLSKALQEREQELDARHAELESAHLQLSEKVPPRHIGGWHASRVGTPRIALHTGKF